MSLDSQILVFHPISASTQFLESVEDMEFTAVITMVFPVLALVILYYINVRGIFPTVFSLPRCKLVPAVGLLFFSNSKQSNQEDKRADNGYRHSYDQTVCKRLGYSVRVRAAGPGLRHLHRW